MPPQTVHGLLEGPLPVVLSLLGITLWGAVAYALGRHLCARACGPRIQGQRHKPSPLPAASRGARAWIELEDESSGANATGTASKPKSKAKAASAAKDEAGADEEQQGARRKRQGRRKVRGGAFTHLEVSPQQGDEDVEDDDAADEEREVQIRTSQVGIGGMD